MFADTDLAAICAVERVNDYPHGLLAVLQSSADCPWIYTGALENYPDLIDELAAIRPLYGNHGRTLQSARDPQFWSRALIEEGLPAPRALLAPHDAPLDGSWLRKPLASAGGQRIQIWSGAAKNRADTESNHDWYFQERKAGVPISAVFVAADGEASLLGATRQLVGGDWRAALYFVDNTDIALHSTDRVTLDDISSFRYSGSIGPLVLNDHLYRKLRNIGDVLSRACGLVGVFGVDAILGADAIWPVEINPRYTASIEVLERASAVRTGRRRSRRLLSIEWHEAACCFRKLPGPLGQSDEAISGKLIYYAPGDCRFSRSAARWAVEQNLGRTRPAVADIPAVDTRFRSGQPLLTVLADGPSESSVCGELQRLAEALERYLAAKSD
jgi:predicted ATP-grasp superfamily ATP-dependent carboligase